MTQSRFIFVEMSQRIRRHKYFLRFLCNAEPCRRKFTICLSTGDQINAINEIALNLKMDNLRVPKKNKTKLAAYNKLITILGERSIPNHKKRRLLVKHHVVIPLLLKPFFKYNEAILRVKWLCWENKKKHA